MARALSAELFLETKILRYKGKYIITSEMIDIARAAAIFGASESFSEEEEITIATVKMAAKIFKGKKEKTEDNSPSSSNNSLYGRKKKKLVIFEIDDKTKTIEQKTIINASDRIRGSVLSTGQFIVVATDQQRMLANKMKRESWGENYDSSTRIELGRMLSADTCLETIIIRSGENYTISLGIVDLGTEKTIRGSSIKFDVSVS